MRNSLYWDDFEKRAEETCQCIHTGQEVPVRRVSVFITNRCNFNCAYCNHNIASSDMSEDVFDGIVKKYGNSAIIHITGGEPSVVKWLYPYIEKYGNKYRFHLNTNAYVLPPSKFIKRLKISLDSHLSAYWNKLVGKNAFDRVVANIKQCIPNTPVSVTFTMTKENYKTIPDFISFAQKEFIGVYALFFSVYKGTNERFCFNNDDAHDFFFNIKPKMDEMLDDESKALLNETIDEKMRVIQGVRFPENEYNKCYLSLSERVFTPDGSVFGCSHLFRDKVFVKPGTKHERCKYGCNRRLVSFNQLVDAKIKEQKV